MGVRLARRVVTALWRVVCVVSWCLLGLWAALALLYNVPLPLWAASLLALGVAALYASALRERFFVRGRQGIPWRDLRWSLAALAVTAAVAVWYFGFIKPNPNEDWIVKHSRMPHVEIVGDKVHISNVRNYTWRTPTDFTPGYEDRVFDVSALDSMYFALSPIFDLEPVAHVWVCFGFSDGQHVAVSVEARGVNGRPFGLFPSLFRQFQLIYVIGDERDVVGLRGVARKAAVRFYPVRTTKEGMRALFLDMMERAHSLEEHPEFYNLIANNCLNNVTHHVRRLGGPNTPSELRLLLTGFSDRLAFDYGFIDTDLPFEKAREAYRIDEWMQSTTLDDTFSKRLRETLRRQGADKVP
ncbi:MAG TPA: DUF4105 domain-containing protein [Gemmataceae bacterium]|nr:DUF4105 domain-containing protein [Gemmataceae bacterium]